MMTRTPLPRLLFAAMLCATTSLASEKSHDDGHPAAEPKVVKMEDAAKAHTAPHWNYGPPNWGELDPAFAMCGAGKAQSPIDVAVEGEKGGDKPVMAYKPTPLTVVNNGHTLQVTYLTGSELVLRGKSYELKQFHFHTPSEHVAHGSAAPMEVHLVHKDKDGNLAVVGVMFEEGAENPTLAKILAVAPHGEGEVSAKGVEVDASAWLPEGTGFVRYNGSLTTPPCSEGVKWMVATKRVQASAAQLEAMRAIMKNNARPVQPLNGRMVLDVE
ncbi:MAG: hypothetical protein GC129_01070 [Proteobacteria bacterium]|nr:hypothetical protein [Pseudomonadota bacterium]